MTNATSSSDSTQVYEETILPKAYLEPSNIFEVNAHNDSVHSICSCGHIVISGSEDHTIKVWGSINTQTNEELKERKKEPQSKKKSKLFSTKNLGKINTNKTLKGHDDAVTQVINVFHWIVSSSKDGTLKVWNVYTDWCNFTLRGHKGGVNTVVKINDKRIASASEDCTVKIWKWHAKNIHNNEIKCELTLEGHSHGVYSLAKLSDDRIASGSADNTIRIWDRKAFFNKCAIVLQGHTNVVSTLLQSHDRTLVSGSSDTTIKIWDVDEGNCISTLSGHIGPVTALIELHGKELVSASEDRSIRIWDRKKRTCLAIHDWHSSGITALNLLQDGNLCTGTQDGIIKVWNIEAPRLIESIKNSNTFGISHLLELQDGNFAFSCLNKEIHIWNRSSKRTLKTLEGHDWAPIPLLELKSKNLVSFSADLKILIWNMENYKVESQLEGHSRAINHVIELANGHIASCSDDGKIKIWDWRKQVAVATLSEDEKSVFFILEMDSDRLVSCTGVINVWDMKKKEKLATYGTYVYGPQILMKICDSKVARWTHKYGELWDLKQGKRLRHCNKKFDGLTDSFPQVIMLGNGDFLSYDENENLNVYSGKNWSLKGALNIPDEILEVLSIYKLNNGIYKLNNGNVAIVQDGYFSIWNSQSFNCIAKLSNHTEVLGGVLQLKDGLIVSWSLDETIKFWDLSQPLFPPPKKDSIDVSNSLTTTADAFGTEIIDADSDVASISSSTSSRSSSSVIFSPANRESESTSSTSLSVNSEKQSVIQRLSLLEELVQKLTVENAKLNKRVSQLESVSRQP